MISRTKASLSVFALAVLLFSAGIGFGQAGADSASNYSSNIEAQARRAPMDFKPDGDVSKHVWKHAKWAEFDDVSGKSNHADALTRVAAEWTDKYIYFAFWCRYEALNTYEGEDISKERWELWNRDVVEVFLNPHPERVTHYYEFEVAPNNQWIDLEIEKNNKPFNDPTWNSGFEHATRVDSKNHVWTAEMRIPLQAIKVDSIRAGAKWRVNFFRAAGQGTDDHRRFLAWSAIPDGATFHVPTRFGILTLVE
jgi:alpha-galactosidase